ncbi:cilia- and flagella-associated protein 410-like [Stegodyphus dumicola]|uniref:cilia- and flagella-associated protein 410-like n=1 Tax=Stegodyphus dumicola TaxID=202533 RepID=UPI0015AEDF63|nr:cilia- and flagella-associated protein 410-like [Stegodyphus dumicola]XP_035213298.1 cilia- and flagella-associated protein 410-like [Stegodyphus dumicola]XP_035213299.1 cilia- and flagella-associated protein 410-like [Stegodyphus dumicola]XP_035213300.1 cilia- and flagella-associated protein 410-like [Stegodyphus dumicola]
MTKLTEHTVLARTRAQDLKSVRKLNAWGSELTDVSIVKKLPNVEVLSLSVNAISSLEDFSHCNNLQELYIRKNNISELGEIRHLKDLQKLRNLWLADNPCAEGDDYRLTVIRALPQLQKLDNVPIRPDEIESAKKHGSPLELLLPKEESSTPQTTYVSQPPPQTSHAVPTSSSFEEISSVTHTESFSIESSAFSPSTPNNGTETYNSVKSSVKQVESVNHVSHTSFQEKLSPESPYFEKDDSMQQNTVHSSDSSPGATNPHLSGRFQDNFERELPPENESAFEAQGAALVKDHFLPKCAFAAPYSSKLPPRERPLAIRMLPKGGKSRAANILSAVLCLIKELDWASLEVVDTAIHCQMEELEEQNSS